LGADSVFVDSGFESDELLLGAAAPSELPSFDFWDDFSDFPESPPCLA
jgi:hypothetical protein